MGKERVKQAIFHRPYHGPVIEEGGVYPLLCRSFTPIMLISKFLKLLLPVKNSEANFTALMLPSVTMSLAVFCLHLLAGVGVNTL